MWFPLTLCLWAISAAPTERLLLLEDAQAPNLERKLVHQQLLHNLLRDPATQVVAYEALPVHLNRAVALQEQANLLVEEARGHLHALNPAEAATAAAAAALRYGRVAELTGDVTGLCDALSLQAAAHLLVGDTSRAEHALCRLLTLDGAFVPSPTLFNRSMQAAVRRVARRVQQGPHQRVTVGADDDRAALFVDGHFVGFGRQELSLFKGVPHYLYLVPEYGEGIGCAVVPNGKGGSFAPEVRLTPWPADPAPPSSAAGAFGHVLAASRLPTGEIDPYHPALAARRVDTVLVLAYTEGALRLTTFELRQGQRRVTQAVAAITDVWDVSRIANELLAAPPPLAALPDR
jgi:hypothetical protein